MSLNLDQMYIDDDDVKSNILETLESSWVDSMDKDAYISKESNIPIKDKVLELTDILNSNIEELDDIKILEYQTTIIGYLKKLLKNDNIDITDLTSKIDYLILSSKILSLRFGMNLLEHKQMDTKIIPRSSYKFCNYNYGCEFNYNHNKKNGCYAQHYVFNLVYADTTAIKKYIVKNENNLNINELRKSINTALYVVNHMFEEYTNALKYNYTKKNKHVSKPSL